MRPPLVIRIKRVGDILDELSRIPTAAPLVLSATEALHSKQNDIAYTLMIQNNTREREVVLLD